MELIYCENCKNVVFISTVK